MGADSGRRAVVGEAMAAASRDLAAAQAESEGDQLPLFDIPTRFVRVRDGAPAGPDDERAARVRALAAEHKAGRPAGAVNKSTAELRRYLLARGVHPLQQLMRWAMHSPESLAAELGCSRLEAFREWRQLQTELAPYFAAKVVPVDDAGNAVPFFQMVIGGAAPIAPSATAVPPWLVHVEQNQSLIEGKPELSHDAKSHEEPK